MEYWQDFIRYEHANSILMALGAVLVFFSVIQILKSSFKMLIWILFAGIGALSLSYGFQHSPLDLPALDQIRLTDLRELAPDSDVLNYLCQKIGFNGSET